MGKFILPSLKGAAFDMWTINSITAGAKKKKKKNGWKKKKWVKKKKNGWKKKKMGEKIK